MIRPFPKRPRDLSVQPKPPLREKDIRRGLHMTIAIGYKFKEGVLFCADTRLTNGSSKQHGQKLFKYSIDAGTHPPTRAAFAISGNVPYARMAIDKCVTALRTIPVDDRTHVHAKEKIEETLLVFYRDHIYRHPNYRSGVPDFELLIAYWSHVNGLGFFYTHETTVNSADIHKCLGMGADLAEYLIRATYKDPEISSRKPILKTLVSLMAHVLHVVKENVENCGGSSTFLVFGVDGKISDVENADVSFAEDVSDNFQEGIRHTLLRATDLDVPDKSLRDDLSYLYQILKAMRKKEKKNRAEWEPIIKRLSTRR